MSATEKRFDVRIVTVPTVTPEGEPFGIALARAFGVQLWQAEQIARDAPVLVKRGVTLEVAQKLQALLITLGAEAGIVGDLPVPVPASVPAPVPDAASAPTILGIPTLPSGLPAPPPSPSAVPPPGPLLIPEPEPEKRKVPSLPPLALPAAIRRASSAPPPLDLPPPGGSVRADEVPPWLPPSGEIQLETVAASPAMVQRQLRDDLAASLLVSALPGTPAASALPRSRPPLPLPESPRRFPITPGTIAVVAILALALAWSVAGRWLNRMGDAKLLGNTPNTETACKTSYCVAGVGLDDGKRGRRTLVVAWRSGCLESSYRAFLEGLAEAHPGDLEVVGVFLTVPVTGDPRAFGLHPEPPPLSWPPSDCIAHFDALAPDRAYASDWLSPPVTYLSDADGKLIAVWRGGMVQEQRDRLATWLDGKVWESK